MSTTVAAAPLLAEGAAEVEAGSDRPFLLSGAGAWTVTAGRIDVFAVPLRDGRPAGSRSHLFRVETGAVLFGAGERAPAEVGLLAVGAPGTRVAAVEPLRLRAAALDPSRTAELAARLEEWVDLLCAAVARGTVPDGVEEVAPGDADLPTGARYVRPGRRVAWVRHLEGSSLLLGRDGLKVNGDFTPLSRRAWMEVKDGARLDLLDTPEALERGEAWDGLARLHALVLDCVARIAAEASEAERERLRAKAAASRGAFAGAMSRLASTLDSGSPAKARVRMRASEGAGEDLLVAAARLVGGALDVPVVAPPRDRSGPAPRDPLAAVARASRFRVRQVVLREGWWREDGGPMLAYMADDERPVALLPAPGTRYLLHDPRERTEVPVDAALADALKPIAFTFYRPFADQALGIGDVVRFGLQGCGKDLGMVVGMSAAAALLSLVTPIATGMIFNDIIPSADRSQLFQLTLALLAIAAATLLFRLASGIALVRIEGKMGAATQAAVWDRVLGLPMPFFRPYTAGNLAARAMGIDQIRQVLSGATVTALLGGAFSVFHFGLLFWYAPRMAVWATGLILLSIAVAAAASRAQMKHEHRIAALQSRLQGSVLQFLSSIAKLRTAAAEGQAFAIWARGFSEQRQLQFRARSIGNLLAAFHAAYPVIASVVLYAVALPLITRPEEPLRTGDFMAFMSSFTTCLAGMLAASSALMAAMAVVPMYEQARPILETLPEVDTAKADPGVLTGAIDIERVTFRYAEDGPPILRDLTMRIKPGEFVAFVGPSGSGKSTLLRLLLGFEKPESGGVYYDGRELAGLDAQAVRRQIGVVLQNGRLMSGDLFTNITGSSPATLEDAWEAARMAGFDEDIRAMPMGMHTVISEGASTLSGGQRQRLMIARAIVQRPRILFFDEATSALDNRTQAIVTESLDRLNATRIVIAHRLSTILHADRIFVIEAGRIVQTGTYAELIEQEGLFAELAKRQLA